MARRTQTMGRKQIAGALTELPQWRQPSAYLSAWEHYDVSDEGMKRADWIEQAADRNNTPYIVSINTGGYTGMSVAVIAANTEAALEAADEWTATRFYDGDSDDMHGKGEGPHVVEMLESIQERGASGWSGPRVNPKTFPTGTLVKKTSKFLRSIGSVTRGPVDGLVLGSDDTRLLVAWSDGLTYQIQAANVQKTKKQMEPASARATVTAERDRTRQTMDTEMWSPEEIDEVVASYVRDDLAANPGRRLNPAPPQTTQTGLVGRLKF